MCTARAMAVKYEQQRHICKYVHSTSQGHEAIQLAAAFNLLPCDFVSPYYRDESLLLGLGFTPYQLMLQLLAKGDDIFSGGKEYYSHPSYLGDDKPTIIHQSSATGMQAIPATGLAQGILFLEITKSALYKNGNNGEAPVVICSLGDASVTEGEVSEAMQVAVLKQLPIIYLVQDNDWGISVTSPEARNMDAYRFAKGFKGMERVRTDGSNFSESYRVMKKVIADVRTRRRPWLVHAKVPLMGHHTSGVRKEFYRTAEELELTGTKDPLVRLHKKLLLNGFLEEELSAINEEAKNLVDQDFEKAVASPDPVPSGITDHIFCATPVTKETGNRTNGEDEKVMVVDAASHAIKEIMEDDPDVILYGQDVGKRLGGVFRETATLGELFGDHRVFNTAIQEAYIIGSTVGMSAVGVKTIVEIQFGDYIFPGINQLYTEVAKSCFLSNGKFPVKTVIRVPVGAYGGGGPYHSASIESILLKINGIKIVYPSNAADMKGLIKAAFLDPNPVVMLEHKGLYWSKVPGTEEAKTIEPSRNYILPLGKANIVLQADQHKTDNGETLCIVTYGMGVYWSKTAAKEYPGQIEIIDLRTLNPLDENLIFTSVKKHGKCLVVTEEQQTNSFAEALAARISKTCFKKLDAPVEVIGALDLPAVPMNIILEKEMLPNAEKVAEKISALLNF